MTADADETHGDRRKLSRSDLHEDPVRQFECWFKDASNANIPDANVMTLATVSTEQRPSQRVVLLKQFDDSGFVFYTNLESRKAHEIATNPNVSLHFAWLTLNRQLIIGGQAEKLSVTEALAYFITRPKNSQIGAWASRQSRPISSRQLLEQQFNVMKEKFSKGEIPLPSFWGGYRVRPETFEFWQSRPHRLHDRFLYRRHTTEQSWLIERLSP